MTDALQLRDNALARITRIRELIQFTDDIGELKKIVDTAEAVRHYSRQQKLGEDIEREAVSIKLEALKKLGELLKAMPKATGGQPYQNPTGTKTEPVGTPTLAQLGIDKKISSLAQQVASLTDDETKAVVNGVKSINETLSFKKKEDKKEERDQFIRQQREDIASGKAVLAAGLYEVIAIDPPWAYEEKGGFSPEQHDADGNRGGVDYPTMTVEQIKNLKLPLTDPAVVFLWTTQAFLNDAFEILKAWGLTYKATIVWDKDMMGMGRTIRLQCEFCLLAFNGKPIFEGSSERDIIRAKRREHSRKPDEFYQLVDRTTVGRKLEYFSREQRNGWEIYGNDTNKF